MRYLCLISAFCIVFVPSFKLYANDLYDLFMSPADEAQIGREEHPKILAEFGGAYSDPAITSYVDSIGQFLVQTTETPDAPFTFTVLNSPIVNAFALPGGYVYVTRGLLALAGSEAELAGVIAHEIGHVTARHGADRAGNNVLANLGLTVLGIVSGSQLVNKVGQLGTFAVLQSHSREDEFEADQRGVKYLVRAGFDPNAMSSFLAKLHAHSRLEAKIKGVSPDEGFGFFATHPRTPDRVERAVQLAKVQKVREPIIGQEIYFKKIDGLLFGSDETQGFIKGQRFVHPVLRFEFTVPDGFNILNGETSVIAKGPGGSALQFDSADRNNATVESYLRDKWARGEILSRIESIRINGMPAATAILNPDRESSEAIIRLVVIGFNSKLVYRFMFATPRALPENMRRSFEHTALSFRRLNEMEAKQNQPLKLGFHQVVPGDTPQKLSARMAVGKFKLEKFKVLNGLSGNEALSIGNWAKLIVE